MLIGNQSWSFLTKPVIISSAAVGGPFEANGALANDFDVLFDDMWMGENSFEKAERKMMETACQKVIDKAGLKTQDIKFFLSGDLMNQLFTSSFAARTLSIPFIGIFGACSSSIEGLALAALLVDSGASPNALTASSSHNATAEKQFRYPTEYGAQKPPTAQWTVSGAGAAIIQDSGLGPKVISATIGKVIDMGLQDPYNMGAAMAPAAVDTILAHFNDLAIDESYYDLIATGDLGRVGHQIAKDLLIKKGVNIPDEKFTDCGLLIYKKEQPVMAGGSGCACSATVTYGHLLKKMQAGKYQRILIVATGALLSPLSYQQKESIPCIAHAVAIEK